MARAKYAQGLCKAIENNRPTLTYILQVHPRVTQVIILGVAMIWIIGAVLAGLAVGYISHAYQKLFFALLVLTLPIAVILYSRVVLPLAAVSGLAELTGRNPITLTMQLIGLLPQNIQSAILIFPMAAFSGRLLTWFYSILTDEPVVEETKEDRKSRVLTEYGYTDGKLPY